MDVLEIFHVLGIEPTKDERSIKNAYREQLTHTNPEDDPEGFKRLRAAFERANEYAKSEDTEAGNKKEVIDDTPSGRWVQRAAEIYKNINTRCDVEDRKSVV